MHPSVMAELATQHRNQLIRDAETRRLRACSATRTRTGAGRRTPAHFTQSLAKRLAAMVRPAPEPCCP